MSELLSAGVSVKRVDLHCHSRASDRPAEAALRAIACQECYSDPADVYRQAVRRGMNFVTLTDHDTIAGALEIAHLENAIVGEELTCFFPEDGCKIHLLLWGITAADHEALQALARDIYAVAGYVESRQIAHAVAHPIYRQNDKLERWHLERLLLQFKGFECLNGLHSPLHREAFEPLVEKLDEARLMRLSERHRMPPRWSEPWVKSRTGGSDDHGLLNVGGAWTEFPAAAASVSDILSCLRMGLCKPGGEAGSGVKLAHTLYSVAFAYAGSKRRQTSRKPGPAARLLQTFAGQAPPPTKWELARWAARHKLRSLGRRVLHPFSPPPKISGSERLKNLFIDAAIRHLPEHPDLIDAWRSGLPALGEHDDLFRLICQLDRDILRGVAAGIAESVDQTDALGLFEGISALLSEQCFMLPYYFALFHQNKERRLLRRLTGQDSPIEPGRLRVGLFTDTFDDINGVARFLQTLGSQSERAGYALTIHTCGPTPANPRPWRKNFEPTLSGPMPYYPALSLRLPPLAQVMEWVDRQQFDAIHISTPGPMGLCGLVAAKMLRVPILGTYHTDFPAYARQFTADHRLATAAESYMRWLYGSMAAVFARSSAYIFHLRDLGIAEEKLATIPPCVDEQVFNPRRRNESIWKRLGVRDPHRVLYVGRLSVEKNLPLLAEVFDQIFRQRFDVALVIAGDGPYRQEMEARLRGRPAHFLGEQADSELSELYASADFLVFPSRTDTLGQVVTEAAASALPAIVSSDGGPREIVENEITGLVISNDDAGAWRLAILRLLDDAALRRRMGRAAAIRAGRYSPERTFEAFWSAHLAAANPPPQPVPEPALAEPV